MRALCSVSLMLLASAALAQPPDEPITGDFDGLDVDGDGYINRVEADDRNIWYHFDAVDKNKDKLLSREEFAQYLAEENPAQGEKKQLSELPEPYLRERSQSDSDVVTNPELLPKIRGTFDDLDRNNDRFISRDEARGDNVHEHFLHMDRDDDSRVSSGEFNSYLREHGTQVATKEVMDETRL